MYIEIKKLKTETIVFYKVLKLIKRAFVYENIYCFVKTYNISTVVITRQLVQFTGFTP